MPKSELLRERGREVRQHAGLLRGRELDLRQDPAQHRLTFRVLPGGAVGAREGLAGRHDDGPPTEHSRRLERRLELFYRHPGAPEEERAGRVLRL